MKEFDTIEKNLHKEILERICFCEYDDVLTILKCFKILKEIKDTDND